MTGSEKRVYEPPMLTYLGKVGDRTRIAAVSAESGWELEVDRMLTVDGLRYNAHLISPDGKSTMMLFYWRDLERVHESIGGYLRREGLGPTAAALRAAVEAEVRS